jgi:hypothetical protein
MSFSFKPTEGANSGVPQMGHPGESVTSGPSSSPSSLNLAPRFSAEGRGIIQLALMAIFGICILITIGLFGYSFYLNSQINSKKAKLSEYEKKLANFKIEEIRGLSNRMKIISQLIKEHPSVNVAFRILEDSVENPVVYKRFDLRYSEVLRAYELQLVASAPDYRSVVEQMDTFKAAPYANYIRSVSIDGLHPDDTGKVSFNLKMPITIVGILPDDLAFAENDTVSQVTESISSTRATTTVGLPGNATSTTNGTTSAKITPPKP